MWTFEGQALRWAAKSIASLDCDYAHAEFSDGRMAITGDDLATKLQLSVPAISAGMPFTCGLPADLLSRILKSMGDGDATVARHNERVILTSGESDASLRTSTEIPDLRRVQFPDLGGTVKRARLTAAFEAVGTAASTDATSSLHGVRLEASRGDSWVVACDRYRMHAVMMTGRLGFGEPVTIPTGALKLVSSVGDQVVKVGTSDDTFFVQGDSGRMSTSGIAGEFISDWASHLKVPKNPETVAEFDSTDLVAAVRQVYEPLGCDTVTLALSPDDHRITVSGANASGTMTAKCLANVTGGETVVSYGVHHLLDAVKNLGSEAVMTVPPAFQLTHFRSGNMWFQAIVSPQRH